MQRPPARLARQGGGMPAKEFMLPPSVTGSAITVGDALAPRYGSGLLPLKPSFFRSRAASVFRAARVRRFCEVCLLRPLRVPHRSFSRHSCESAALRRGGPASPVETRWFAVTAAPLRARHSQRGPKPSAPFSLHQQLFLARAFTLWRPPMAHSSLSHGEAVRPASEECVNFAPRDPFCYE